MPNKFNPHLQTAMLEVVENQLVEQQAIAIFINKKNTERHTLCARIEAQSTTLTAYRKRRLTSVSPAGGGLLKRIWRRYFEGNLIQ